MYRNRVCSVLLRRLEPILVLVHSSTSTSIGLAQLSPLSVNTASYKMRACGAVAQPSAVISHDGLSVSVLCQRGLPLERCRVEGASPKSSNDSKVYVSSTGQLTTYGISDRFPNDEEFILNDNDTLAATCAFPDFPPPSYMSWYLGEYGEVVVWPRPAIVVAPPMTVARQGDRVTVVCHAESALKFCRIEKLAPNVGPSRRSWYLNESLPATQDSIKYAGSGLSQGDCGFTVERVTIAFNAQFRCVVGFSNQPDEGIADFNISVA
ncbi:Fasciclin-3, partial [Gryllus bimaculatus]